MKTIFVTHLFTLLLVNVGYAQNLVLNPGFEEYSICPDWENQIEQANNWMNFGNTPDYFNFCANTIQPSYSIPQNTAGYQIPLSGQAYAGMLSYEDSTNYKEFIGGTLSTPLTIGQKYFISLNVSSTADQNSINCVSNGMGIKFSTLQYSQNNLPELTNNAIVYAQEIISDTLNWTYLSGAFIADSVYTNIVIGNFFDDATIDIHSIIPNNPYCGYAYFFVDDICVSTDSLACVRTSNLNEVKDYLNIIVYQNTINQEVVIESPIYPLDINIYNSIGQIIYSKSNFYENKITINTETFDSDLLFLKITNHNQSKIYKLIKH